MEQIFPLYKILQGDDGTSDDENSPPPEPQLIEEETQRIVIGNEMKTTNLLSVSYIRQLNINLFINSSWS